MAAARIISTEKFIVGVTNGRERHRYQVSDGKIEWVLSHSSTVCLRFDASGSTAMR